VVNIIKGTNTDKHTCVCATCGQGFTRNSSALRHNCRLHSGQAMIVRPYEYIIGRLNGEFLRSDPANYRTNRRKQSNFSIYNQSFQAKNNERTNPKIHADVAVLEPHPTNLINPMNQKRASYDSPKTPQRPINQETPYSSNLYTERESKLNELKVLLYKCFPPEHAAQLFAQNSILAITAENNAYLEFVLDGLRMRSRRV
jgi:hypothetical protein